MTRSLNQIQGATFSTVTLVRMDAREETLNLLSNIWVKLRGLPDANHVELGAFFVVLTFICEPITSLSCISLLLLLFPGLYLLSCCSGGPAHDSADVCELLLLPPPPRDKDEGVQRLSQWSSQEGGRVQKAFLRGSVPTPRQTLERAPGGSR